MDERIDVLILIVMNVIFRVHPHKVLINFEIVFLKSYTFFIVIRQRLNNECRGIIFCRVALEHWTKFKEDESCRPRSCREPVTTCLIL